MCKFSSLDIILGQQKDELNLEGLETSDDLITSTLQLRLVLQQRVRTLLKAKVIKPGDILRIQIVYDDESVVGVKGKEGLLVNSVENNLPCAFFLRDDCYEDVMKSLPTLPQQIDTLLAEGLMVDGKKHGVERFIERMVELAHEPSVDGWSTNKRQTEQQKHYGQCRGRPPYICLPTVMYYIADILHNMLRVVPQIFLHTIQEHCTAEKLQEVGQWCYDNLKLVISEDIYLQTEKGVKKLNVSAESWPGATCRLLLDNFKNILEIAIDKHEEGEAKREGHVQAQASLQHKYPSHQFNQSRALKRAKME
eukprot:jgi/Tetstr1/429756/TSEL_001932.t1